MKINLLVSFKHRLLQIVVCVSPFLTQAQTFWSDNFNNSCTAGCLATTWNGWTLVDNVGGTTGSAPNAWFVSCAEEGIAAPGCGSTTCSGDASLHIGLNDGSGGDMGATYNETGVSNATFRLIVSPTINASGKSSITLKFDFIAYGSSACSDDRAQLRLSADGGATWPVGYQYCLTSVCCGSCNGYSAGQWTTYTLALPAAFDNNSNIKIGFHWRNNGNGSGTDPSVAIDDISLSTTALPITLIDFTSQKEKDKINLKWTTTDEKDFSHFVVERSKDAKAFTEIGKITSKSTGQSVKNYYAFQDAQQTAVSYYRLKMVDRDNTFKHSKIISVSDESNKSSLLAFENILLLDDIIKLQVFSLANMVVSIDVFDLQGRTVLTEKNKKLNIGSNTLTINSNHLNTGVYLVKVNTQNKTLDISRKIFKIKSN